MISVTNYLVEGLAKAIAQANPNLEAALENLADISLGQSPSIWPLAWGWWVFIGLAILAIAGIFWFIAAYIQKHQVKRSALKAINRVTADDTQALVTLHAILRRSIMHYFGSQDINSLQGEAWQQFLQETAKHAKKIDHACLSQLAQLEASLYTKVPSIDVNDAKQAVTQWIKHALPPSASELSAPKAIHTGQQGVQHV